MLKIEKTETYCWEAAIRGMRNPMNSWDRNDTVMKNMVLKANEIAPGVTAYQWTPCMPFPVIGPNDYERMKQLRLAGDEHAKLFRMIIVTCDITAPLYWWKEFDTYKVGTVGNSCSTMHKIAAKEFTIDDFSHEHLFGPDDMTPYEERDDISKDRALTAVDVDGATCYYTPKGLLQMTCNALNHEREKYLTALKTEEETGLPAKDIWWQMIQLLPSSYNQKRTELLNYQVLAHMYQQRKNHKQDEWRVTFCDWIKTLPYSEFITGEFKDESK